MSKPAIVNAEEALEAGKSLTKKTGKSAVSSAGNIVKTAVSQITGSSSDNSSQADQDTKDFVKGLYGTSGKQQAISKKNQSSSSQNTNDSSLVKNPEEQEKLAKVRADLKKRHDEFYYQPLVNPPKQQEERPAEKVEKEKQEEMIDLQKKEREKPPPLAVQRAQTKTEKFPGGGG